MSGRMRLKRVCEEPNRLTALVIPSSVNMRTRFLQRPNRSEGPCAFVPVKSRLQHKVPPTCSRAGEFARSLYGRRDHEFMEDCKSEAGAEGRSGLTTQRLSR
jgi:hypothetical protein